MLRNLQFDRAYPRFPPNFSDELQPLVTTIAEAKSRYTQLLDFVTFGLKNYRNADAVVNAITHQQCSHPIVREMIGWSLHQRQLPVICSADIDLPVYKDQRKALKILHLLHKFYQYLYARSDYWDYLFIRYLLVMQKKAPLSNSCESHRNLTQKCDDYLQRLLQLLEHWLDAKHMVSEWPYDQLEEQYERSDGSICFALDYQERLWLQQYIEHPELQALRSLKNTWFVQHDNGNRCLANALRLRRASQAVDDLLSQYAFLETIGEHIQLSLDYLDPNYNLYNRLRFFYYKLFSPTNTEQRLVRAYRTLEKMQKENLSHQYHLLNVLVERLALLAKESHTDCLFDLTSQLQQMQTQPLMFIHNTKIPTQGILFCRKSSASQSGYLYTLTNDITIEHIRGIYQKVRSFIAEYINEEFVQIKINHTVLIPDKTNHGNRREVYEVVNLWRRLHDLPWFAWPKRNNSFGSNPIIINTAPILELVDNPQILYAYNEIEKKLHMKSMQLLSKKPVVGKLDFFQEIDPYGTPYLLHELIQILQDADFHYQRLKSSHYFQLYFSWVFASDSWDFYQTIEMKLHGFHELLKKFNRRHFVHLGHKQILQEVEQLNQCLVIDVEQVQDLQTKLTKIRRFSHHAILNDTMIQKANSSLVSDCFYRNQILDGLLNKIKKGFICPKSILSIVNVLCSRRQKASFYRLIAWQAGSIDIVPSQMSKQLQGLYLHKNDRNCIDKVEALLEKFAYNYLHNMSCRQEYNLFDINLLSFFNHFAQAELYNWFHGMIRQQWSVYDRAVKANQQLSYQQIYNYFDLLNFIKHPVIMNFIEGDVLDLTIKLQHLPKVLQHWVSNVFDGQNISLYIAVCYLTMTDSIEIFVRKALLYRLVNPQAISKTDFEHKFKQCIQRKYPLIFDIIQQELKKTLSTKLIHNDGEASLEQLGSWQPIYLIYADQKTWRKYLDDVSDQMFSLSFVGTVQKIQNIISCFNHDYNENIKKYLACYDMYFELLEERAKIEILLKKNARNHSFAQKKLITQPEKTARKTKKLRQIKFCGEGLKEIMATIVVQTDEIKNLYFSSIEILVNGFNLLAMLFNPDHSCENIKNFPKLSDFQLHCGSTNIVKIVNLIIIQLVCDKTRSVTEVMLAFTRKLFDLHGFAKIYDANGALFPLLQQAEKRRQQERLYCQVLLKIEQFDDEEAVYAFREEFKQKKYFSQFAYDEWLQNYMPALQRQLFIKFKELLSTKHELADVEDIKRGQLLECFITVLCINPSCELWPWDSDFAQRLITLRKNYGNVYLQYQEMVAILKVSTQGITSQLLLFLTEEQVKLFADCLTAGQKQNLVGLLTDISKNYPKPIKQEQHNEHIDVYIAQIFCQCLDVEEQYQANYFQNEYVILTEYQEIFAIHSKLIRIFTNENDCLPTSTLFSETELTMFSESKLHKLPYWQTLLHNFVIIDQHKPLFYPQLLIQVKPILQVIAESNNFYDKFEQQWQQTLDRLQQNIKEYLKSLAFATGNINVTKDNIGVYTEYSEELELLVENLNENIISVKTLYHNFITTCDSGCLHHFSFSEQSAILFQLYLPQAFKEELSAKLESMQHRIQNGDCKDYALLQFPLVEFAKFIQLPNENLEKSVLLALQNYEQQMQAIIQRVPHILTKLNTEGGDLDSYLVQDSDLLYIQLYAGEADKLILMKNLFIYWQRLVAKLLSNDIIVLTDSELTTTIIPGLKQVRLWLWHLRSMQHSKAYQELEYWYRQQCANIQRQLIYWSNLTVSDLAPMESIVLSRRIKYTIAAYLQLATPAEIEKFFYGLSCLVYMYLGVIRKCLDQQDHIDFFIVFFMEKVLSPMAHCKYGRFMQNLIYILKQYKQATAENSCLSSATKQSFSKSIHPQLQRQIQEHSDENKRLRSKFKQTLVTNIRQFNQQLIEDYPKLKFQQICTDTPRQTFFCSK